MNRRRLRFPKLPRRSRQGMVLFEVVMALFIFTLVAFSLVMALDSAFDAAKERNEIDEATRGLKNQMELLHAARVVPGDNDLPDDGSGILYHLTVLQEQMQDQKNKPVANMYRTTITATWKSNGEAEERDVSELIYQP
jgi:type II secretory pathway component PulJ